VICSRQLFYLSRRFGQLLLLLQNKLCWNHKVPQKLLPKRVLSSDFTVQTTFMQSMAKYLFTWGAKAIIRYVSLKPSKPSNFVEPNLVLKEEIHIVNWYRPICKFTFYFNIFLIWYLFEIILFESLSLVVDRDVVSFVFSLHVSLQQFPVNENSSYKKSNTI